MELKYNDQKISNLRPVDHICLPVAIIPPGVSDYTINLNYPLMFPLKTYDVIIDRCRVILDTSGIRNIPNFQGCLVGGVLKNIYPGYYLTQLKNPDPFPNNDSGDLVSLLNIKVPRSGGFSFQAKTTVDLDLTNAPDIQKILGFTSPIISANTVSPNIINETMGYDNLFIYCDLIKQSSPSSQIPLIDVPVVVPFGEITTNISSGLNIPIIVENNSSFTYRLRKKDGSPFICYTPITIFTDILIYKRI